MTHQNDAKHATELKLANPVHYVRDDAIFVRICFEKILARRAEVRRVDADLVHTPERLDARQLVRHRVRNLALHERVERPRVDRDHTQQPLLTVEEKVVDQVAREVVGRLPGVRPRVPLTVGAGPANQPLAPAVEDAQVLDGMDFPNSRRKYPAKKGWYTRAKLRRSSAPFAMCQRIMCIGWSPSRRAGFARHGGKLPCPCVPIRPCMPAPKATTPTGAQFGPHTCVEPPLRAPPSS